MLLTALKRDNITFDERELLYIKKLPRELRAKLEVLTGRPEFFSQRPPSRQGAHWAEKRAAKQYVIHDELNRKRFVTVEEAAEALDISVASLEKRLKSAYSRSVTEHVEGRDLTVTRLPTRAK